MQTSILSVLLALGLPGANSCSAQQQGLPRVGQNPPAATQGEEPTPVVSDEEEVDEPEEMEVGEIEVDDAEEGDQVMAEIAEIKAEKSCCAEVQAKSVAKSHCEGSGSCNTQSSPQLGQSKLRAGSVALGGEVVHIDENDLDGSFQKVTIQPGSTVILKTKNGEQVVLRAQGADGLQSTSSDAFYPLMSLQGLGYAGPAAPQKQDERVRELEQRVRELEAQLRERGDPIARSPQPSRERSNQAQAEARDRAAQERAQMRELHTRMSAQARDHAAQARSQADELRRQAEVYQKQMHEQQNLWRLEPQAGQPGEPFKWKVAKAPKPPKAPRAATAGPAGPEVWAEVEPGMAGMAPMPTPDVPPTPGMAAPEEMHVYGSAGPSAPRARALRTPEPARAGNGLGGEHVQELQKMLNDMRRQMDEMRQQMQVLRQELERAPQREMR